MLSSADIYFVIYDLIDLEIIGLFMKEASRMYLLRSYEDYIC